MILLTLPQQDPRQTEVGQWRVVAGLDLGKVILAREPSRWVQAKYMIVELLYPTSISYGKNELKARRSRNFLDPPEFKEMGSLGASAWGACQSQMNPRSAEVKVLCGRLASGGSGVTIVGLLGTIKSVLGDSNYRTRRVRLGRGGP